MFKQKMTRKFAKAIIDSAVYEIPWNDQTLMKWFNTIMPEAAKITKEGNGQDIGYKRDIAEWHREVTLDIQDIYNWMKKHQIKSSEINTQDIPEDYAENFINDFVNLWYILEVYHTIKRKDKKTWI